MTLDPDVPHPARRQYVLKLDRDAAPGQGAVSGRLENLATGRAFEFRDVASLLQGLASELEEQQESPPA
ncbi:hypothetical protein [Mitsuaria sp. GD03876]|uniref:hypothetical protein n=1 Tax=Mitsuaria sp. GD03876 TaxID=2975399 RepID=UPI00244D6614|nr:hypothetical protein [Mitsuaria sp. GD03876]MDH0864518.1 hypothetical protein [Mitsuaria sp. GD03876]